MIERLPTGQSRATDTAVAVSELHGQLACAHTEMVTFFCSPDYDLDVVAAEMNSRFAGVTVVGCTTAGEIGPGGYCERTITGVALPAGTFTAVAAFMDDLQNFSQERGQVFVHELVAKLKAAAPGLTPQNTFALQLIDGLSLREEAVTRVFQHALGSVALVGGSAGDGIAFGRTQVFSGGRFHDGGVVLVLASSTLPFSTFSTQHFTGGEERAVVTAADPATRTVREINASSATAEYARLVGVDPRDLTPGLFAEHPVVVRIGGRDHARSIQKANPDGSLVFYCAIEEGVVLRAARRGDLVADLDQTFLRLRQKLGELSLVIACDCILRSLEIEDIGARERVGEVFRRQNAVGFATYGEQIHGIHVNQTLTGIAFGSGAEGDRG